MSRTSAQPDLNTLIHVFCTGQDELTQDVLGKFAAYFRENYAPKDAHLSSLQTTRGAVLLSDAMLELIRQWRSRNKNNAVQVLRRFSKHLASHGIAVDEDALPREIPDATERLLDMLKFLHTPRTREEILDRYLISERTLRNDLNTLENGWKILGNTIKINRTENTNGRISYNSTVHPLLLPLNLTEIYTLTVGLKEMAQGSAYEDVSKYLADAVYSQLSDYGAKLISGTGQRGLRQISSCYRQEQSVLDRSRGSQLIYLMKQGQRCRIEYDDGTGTVVSVEGIPTVPPGQVRSVGIFGTELQIPLDRIVTIHSLEEYR